ncbi:transcriptional repressor TCF25-domain-containing protein [Hygrophoropsis aurantiaca]|uniref:Transcriptional repressor TCF25-domain-containing protein n=1 Tax=Hygrophoropsis aurantiaca TaxID=72124 RepID=A0ACB8AUC5_9AGAM|nr:transcriptional repressor TCF25-domain-containing protein [Hygrophoropsis aurantiaca]
MPPRLNKRQQREQEELLALGKPASADDISSEDEFTTGPSVGAQGFAALFTPEDDQAIEPEDDDLSQPIKPRKPKKKKKKTPATVHEPDGDLSDTRSALTLSPRTKQAVPTKSTPGAKKGKGKKVDERDDLDQAIAELSIKYPDLQNTTSASSLRASGNGSLASLLTVSIPHLDNEAEMRKFFGSKAVIAAKSSESGPSVPKRRGVAGAGPQRSQLTRPQPSWAMMKQREGLSSRQLTEEELQKMLHAMPGVPHSQLLSEKWWTVEYSKRYRGATKTFMQAVGSGDPEALWRVLQKLPWHVDTLLQLSEVFRHREEYSQAVDYVDRALYAYERAFVGTFTFTNGINRLDFDRVENRPFFLALHRQVTDLQRRGCIRTAFEFGRLLYSLNPWLDPHGVLLHLDFLAIKSGMGSWLLDVWNEFDNRARSKQNIHSDCLDPSALPGWAFARALVLRARESSDKSQTAGSSTDALKQAILAFPSVVPLLADKNDITLSAEIRSHKAFRIHTDSSSLATHAESVLHLLSHLYAQRSATLWKTSGLSKWFQTTVDSILPQLNSQHSNSIRDRFLRMYAPATTRYSVYRHVLVLEQTYRSLFSFIPRDVTLAKQLACDPLPPLSAVTRYDDDFFRGAEDIFAIQPRSRRAQQADQRALERLVPDAAVRGQLQAIFDANPGLAQQLPGGVVQFVQMMGEMPDDALEDMMMGAAMMDGGGNAQWPPDRGVMPGDMPDDQEEELQVQREIPEIPRIINEADVLGQEVDDEGQDVDSDNDEYIAPLPVRVVRNLLNRLWGVAGGAAPPLGDQSSDDSDGHVEEYDPGDVD